MDGREKDGKGDLEGSKMGTLARVWLRQAPVSTGWRTMSTIPLDSYHRLGHISLPEEVVRTRADAVHFLS